MLLDDPVGVVLIDQIFDLGNHVAGGDDEMPSVCSNLTVLVEVDREHHGAADLGAFADDVEVGVEPAVGKLGDPLVHVTEDGLVPCLPGFPGRHAQKVANPISFEGDRPPNGRFFPLSGGAVFCGYTGSHALYFAPRSFNHLLQIPDELGVDSVIGSVEGVKSSRTRPVQDAEHAQLLLRIDPDGQELP